MSWLEQQWNRGTVDENALALDDRKGVGQYGRERRIGTAGEGGMDKVSVVTVTQYSMGRS